MRTTATRLLLAFSCAALAVPAHADAPADPISAETFGWIRDMTPVRGFYVDNLDGNLEATLAVTNSDRKSVV